MHASAWVAAVGTGYIACRPGCRSATGWLEAIGVDVDPTIVERINHGETPFAELDLSVAVSGAVAIHDIGGPVSHCCHWPLQPGWWRGW